MITLNLLPENMRKRECLPKRQLLILLALVAVLGGLVYMIANVHFVTLPGLRQERRTLAQTERQLRIAVGELKTLDQEIARMSGCVDAVKGLYRQRTVWAKTLADVKNVVTEQQRLWLTSFAGRGKTIALNGFAAAASRMEAMRMPERLLQGFRDYSPLADFLVPGSLQLRSALWTGASRPRIPANAWSFNITMTLK